jgi:hypothetical protein
MELLVFLFIGWILWTAVANAARNAKGKQLPGSEPTVPDWYVLAESEHVRMVGGARPAAVLPARTASEESSSELMWDELAGDRELDATGATPAEVVSLESTEVVLPSEALGRDVVTLEREVDWEAEHELFHRRYVDVHSTGSAARHGLLDELRDPAAVRRAVLMAEILGPPKSARR